MYVNNSYYLNLVVMVGYYNMMTITSKISKDIHCFLPWMKTMRSDIYFISVGGTPMY